jgi:nucleoside-diphosphate-sugar epimerase
MRVLVTGGGGFLGGEIVRQLRERGREVRCYSRGEYPALKALGVEQIRGDLVEQDKLCEAVSGCEIIFHAAAKAGIWGSYKEYHRANVLGTQNVLHAAHTKGVRKLVFTSSPSVTFSGQDQEGVNETAPYPDRWLAHYPRSKAEAERLVLAANGAELATVALRPHLIWGPGDPHLVARLVARARADKLRLVGDGAKRVDSVYIENAALAHVLAGETLSQGAPCAGKAYFISNGEPLAMRDLIARILAAAGLPAPKQSVSPGVAYAVGVGLEFMYRLLGRTEEPVMTRFLARQLATAHWFDISAARRDFGYVPRVTIEAGLAKLAKSFNKAGSPAN